METIPLINLVGLIHLCLIAAVVGVIATEGVMEIFPFFRKEHQPSTVRFHVWIDLLVELPLILGILVTGGALVLLVENLTIWHLVKIGCALAAGGLAVSCIWTVLRRKKRLDTRAPEEELTRDSRRIIGKAIILYLFFIPAAVIGAWLAYQRMLTLIH